MRLALRKMMERDAKINIVAEATSGEDAVHMASVHRPDVITMDIEMPGGCGLEATRKIMSDSPAPIIVISSLTRRGSETAVKALQYGAVDYIPKASSFVDLDIVAIEKELLRKVRYWGERGGSIRLQKSAVGSGTGSGAAKFHPSSLRRTRQPDLILIGASTGGPKALPELFRAVKPLACPVVIALHMPPVYTESFARHLGEMTGHRAKEGADGYRLQAGDVIVAPGGRDLELIRGANGDVVTKVTRHAEYSLHPSVDVLFLSAARLQCSITAIVMTGMGDDGRVGAGALVERGVPVIAQSMESCLVYGMPRAVVDAGHAAATMDIPGMAKTLSSWVA